MARATDPINLSAVTNNDILEAVRESHLHMHNLARHVDKIHHPVDDSPIDKFAFVDKYANADVPANTWVTVSVLIDSPTPVLIESILADILWGGDGRITIGDRNLATFGEGIKVMTGIGMILYEQTTVTLKAWGGSSGGTIFIEVMGHALVGNKWSKI